MCSQNVTIILCILQIPSVMLGFNERITKLEKMIKSADSAEPPSDEEDKENLSDVIIIESLF